MTIERRLMVVRHAKASHEDHGTDHARPLTHRGRRDARHIAERLAEMGWIPDRVLCSDAVRTVETWGRMSDRLSTGVEVLMSRRLYGAGPTELGAVLAEQPEALRSMMVVGHNPGWEQVVAVLTGQITPLGTAHVALLTGHSPSWQGLFEPDAPRWQLVEVLRPREDD
jgi:phosphohistidine phosphatase